jgi:hypothetical protein
MIKYVEEKQILKIPMSITCDVCKKEYLYKKDIGEIEEFHHVDFVGGYSSVFGDDMRVACDICQHCLKNLIGEYCRVE